MKPETLYGYIIASGTMWASIVRLFMGEFLDAGALLLIAVGMVVVVGYLESLR